MPVSLDPPAGVYYRTALYRLYDRVGRLLYIGISGWPRIRFYVHKSKSTWWPKVDHERTRIEWHESRTLAEAAEVAAIVSERPVHNVQHQPDRVYPVKIVPAEIDGLPVLQMKDFYADLRGHLERAMAGKVSVVTKNGKPYAVLAPMDLVEALARTRGDDDPLAQAVTFSI